MTTRVPIREGTFREDDQGGRLLASKCTACEQIFFPKTDFCFSCLNRAMAEFVLSRQGRLYSYTTGRLPAAQFSPPYYVGLVDLPEGVRIFAPLKITQSQAVSIGMDMEVIIEVLWEEEGKKVMGYKFKPL